MALTAELVRRGHELHFAFRERPTEGLWERVQRSGLSHGVTRGAAPGRGQLDGWRSVAALVRALADLARYAHPRYDDARVLRERMEAATRTRLDKPFQYEPVGRMLARRRARRLAAGTDAALAERTIRQLARIEDAVPASRRIRRYLEEQRPDVVLATAVMSKAGQIDVLKAARALRIPTGICVASWDNLTNKGLLKFAPERVFVWNDAQRGEAVDLHGIPADRVVATGAQLFDEWFDREPSTTREDFVRKLGLDDAPYAVYLGSSSFITGRGDEVELVLEWVRALRESGVESLRRLGVVVRPHPGAPRRWDGVGLEAFGNAVVWPQHGVMPIAHDARDDFFDTIAHGAAVVGLNTTAMIEAAVIGKSVLTITAPGFAQADTLHFRYLLEENGGFLHVASSLEEHLGQLARVLEEDAADEERRRRFVEWFVRPHGIDRPATPIFADAVEELAGLDVVPPARAGLALRAVLAVEASLSSVVLAFGLLRRRLRRRSARSARGRRSPAEQEAQVARP